MLVYNYMHMFYMIREIFAHTLENMERCEFIHKKFSNKQIYALIKTHK